MRKKLNFKKRDLTINPRDVKMTKLLHDPKRPLEWCSIMPFAYDGVQENALVQYVETDDYTLSNDTPVLRCANNNYFESQIGTFCDELLSSLRNSDSPE